MIEYMTKSETQVMNVLWRSDKPLSCSEIVELSDDKTWKDSYVHSLLKSLMKKDIVKIEAFELVSRGYARKFAPKLSYDEYVLQSSYTEAELKSSERMAALIRVIMTHSDENKIKELI